MNNSTPRRILFFDTETNGLPFSYKAPASDTSNWPRMLQFAYILTDGRNKVEEGSFLIRPLGFRIDSSASRIHHITRERAMAEGIPISDALAKIRALVGGADLLVGHNVDFDIHIVDAEFYRAGGTLPLSERPYICTMHGSKRFCNLPRQKWPKLSELYRILFGEDFEDAHDAKADITATFRCFWELVDRGVIQY